MQPGVVAEHGPGGERGLEPTRRRLLCQVMDLKGLRIDLLRRLQRIAAIDKDRRFIAQHNGEAGRAGEPGQPGKPLAARRHILPLMLVGTRDDKAVERSRRQFVA